MNITTIKKIKTMEVTYLIISITSIIMSLFATYCDRNKSSRFDIKIGEAIGMALFFSFIPLLQLAVIYYASVSIKEYYEK